MPSYVGSVVWVTLYMVRLVLRFFVCLFFLWWARLSKVGNPVWWRLGLCFLFVCCLDEVSYSGCYRWLGDDGSCIQVVSSVWVLTIWYSLGLVWRRQWYPTPVLLPGKSHGRRSLVCSCPWFAKTQTGLGNLIFTFHFHALEMKWQPTPVFFPGESQGRGTCWAAVDGAHRVRHDWSELAAAAAAATLYMWLSSIALLPQLPAFPPQALPTTVSSLTSPQLFSPRSRAALAMRLLHSP